MSTDLHWAERPFQLISTPAWKAEKPDLLEEFAGTMAVVHNIFLRGMNSIYNQAPWVKPNDVQTFLRYIIVWCEFLAAHHDGEEDNIFPYIDKACGMPGLMDTNREQHKAFHDGVEKLQSYAEEHLGRKAAYSGEEVVSIIDEFMPALRKHLAEEIGTLMALEPHIANLKGLPEVGEKEAQQNMGKVGFAKLPYLLLNHDKEWENGKWAGFPPMPWVISLLLRKGLYYVHSDLWKFTPCNVNGKKQAQYAGPPLA
ncbi:hypothetical protein GQ53DRAFT_745945 [Thozetella sp. PMI_491]|nr:hypothetical protein GQ53DRAFT_745945 [Thozetella sp. PMI_491]